ncbi:type VI secretion system-associated FHA domain protein TagH [Massilia soli]|uniref:Type VI secretion system-associated FHA domain protein TagH n=1 Tax=Massilia soli TaxID=2792854 RepID=A0ABS7SPM1_9BURK|nr:type VI secretion system-associated FHA domain protein TagH [Massilia soli]MBZ2208135.1 type VI secretion system-associated FHA domain protein TagH [Massilia soli]
MSKNADISANSEAGSPDALTQAFLRGAGIGAEALPSALTPEQMELIGKLLAASLQGAIDQLALRSLVKQEARADVTMVVVRNNNPLKFFPDSPTVITQMLRKKMPGFMEPLESIEEAGHALRGHQLGVVAGCRAAVDSVINRLAPAKFAAAAPSGVLDSLIPWRRPAALWHHYVRQYGALAGEVNDQFKGAFGPAFLEAYEQEVDRFDKEPAHG